MCHCCVYSFVPVAWRGQKQFHHWELESLLSVFSTLYMSCSATLAALRTCLFFEEDILMLLSLLSLCSLSSNHELRNFFLKIYPLDCADLWGKWSRVFVQAHKASAAFCSVFRGRWWHQITVWRLFICFPLFHSHFWDLNNAVFPQTIAVIARFGSFLRLKKSKESTGLLPETL